MQAILAGLVLVWAAMLWLGGDGARPGLLAFLYAGGSPDWARVARAITELGSFPLVMALAAIGALLLTSAARRGRPCCCSPCRCPAASSSSC